MKKKFTFFLTLLVLALTPSLASSGSYSSLKFTSNSGETYTVATNNLEILVNGENLTFNNTNLTIPLSSLVSMEFGDFGNTPSVIDTVSFDGTDLVAVYNPNGTLVGTFASYSEALDSLGQGVYVIRDAKGNSLKISVEK